MSATIPMAWGFGLAVSVAIFARLAGFDRDRAFYPTVLIVVASLYDLFAVMAGGGALPQELVGFILFASAAVAGFRTSLWFVAAALAGHGVFDFFHHDMIANAGVPPWWPAFCGSYDVTAGLCLAILLAWKPRGAQ